MNNIQNSFFLLLFSILISIFAWPTSQQSQGSISGFGAISTDGLIDGAFAYPALSNEDLIQMNINKFIGPAEKISLGLFSTDVPGNLFFPKQKEYYGGVFPINLKKEHFTVFLDDSMEQELVGMSFQGPFKKLASLGQKKAPWPEMAKLISFKNIGTVNGHQLAGNKQIKLPLNLKSQNSSSYEWKRPAKGNFTEDIILHVQRTPKNNWLMTDFQVAPVESNSLKSIPSFSNEEMSLFMRVHHDNDWNPTDIVGWARFSDTKNTKHVINGLPEKIANVQFDAKGEITWKPFNDLGWMGVVREKIDFRRSHDNFWGNILSFGLQRFKRESRELKEWVNPLAGEYRLKTPLDPEENLILLFVETVEDLPIPNSGNIDLFVEKLVSIRVHRIQ